MRGDSALWEREPKQLPLPKPKRIATGYADLFTWQPRMILLDEMPSGSVCAMRFVAGEGFENPAQDPDPMQPYRHDKSKGTLPVQFREDRGTWRDFASLVPDADGFAPQTMQNAVRLADHKTENLPKSVLVLGLRYDPPNANLDFWRMERFALPGALAGDKYIRSDIRALLEAAEETQKVLWLACKSYARHLLGRGDREPKDKDITGFVSQMQSIPCYWSTLEAKFHAVLQDYTLEKDPAEIELAWRKEVRDALADSWERHRAAVSMNDAWAIRALVKSEGRVSAKIKELNEIIADLAKTPREENR